MPYDRHHHMRTLPKFTRAQFHSLGTPMWKRLRAVSGNTLAFRELMLQTHGQEMVVNCIRGDHGVPNRY